MADDAAQREREQFEAYLSDLEKRLSGKLQGDVVTALRKVWDSPPAEQIEAAIGTPVVPDMARHMLFFPEESDMDVYPDLLANPPDGAPQDHPQFRVQRSFLGVVYLKHLQSWKLVRAFIRAGGLSALVRLFTCPSMVVRAQATEAFGLITNHPGFDWLKTPSYGPDQDLFAAMASLLQEDIVGRCIANYDNPYPSASMQCLEILAFWVSWMRKFYTKDGILRLAPDVLDKLAQWRRRDDGVPSEELELAGKLHDDFMRFEPSGAGREGEASQPTAPEPVSGGGLVGADVDKARREEAEAARRAGNEAFALCQWDAATARYGRALRIDPDDALALSNRAAVYLKQIEEVKDGVVVRSRNERAGLAEAARADASRAVAIDGGSVKAHYRLARALEELSRLPEALREAEAALDLDGDNEAVQELVARLDDLVADFDRTEEERREARANREQEAQRTEAILAQVMGRYSYATANPSAEGEGAAKGEEESAPEAGGPEQTQGEGEQGQRQDCEGEESAQASSPPQPSPLPSDAVFDTTTQDEALLTRLLAGGDGGDDGPRTDGSAAGADLGFLQRSTSAPQGKGRARGRTGSKREREAGSKKSAAAASLPSHAVFMRSLRDAVAQGSDDLVHRILTSVPAKSLKKLFKAALTDELLLAIARALQAQPARDTAEAAAEELQLLRSLAAVDRFGVCLEFAGDDAKQALGARASALLPHLRGAKRKQVARELVERIESGH